jgi:hypothetical protein
MDVDYLAIGGTIQDATRPRKSGLVKNSHSVRQPIEPLPDYQRMLDVVEGKRGTNSNEGLPATDEKQ